MGRLATSAAAEEISKTFWKKSDLFNLGRTGLARQIPGKEMRVVENMAEHALPATTDGDGVVRGAAKHFQLGQDACFKTLSALLDSCLHHYAPDR